MNEKVQQAELFRSVYELLAWKKSFDLKQAELIAWQHNIMEEMKKDAESLKQVTQGCMVLMETDTALSTQIDQVNERIDIIRERIRILEKANES